MNHIIRVALLIVVIPVAVTAGAYYLTVELGDKCWLPRLGAVMVGIGVLIEGAILYNPKTRGTLDTMQPGRKWLEFAMVVVLFGTLLWAFGDCVKDIFGVSTCSRS